MATWNILMTDGSTQDVEAHKAYVSDTGALYFTNNGEDCSLKIIAPGIWKEVNRTKNNVGGYPI